VIAARMCPPKHEAHSLAWVPTARAGFIRHLTQEGGLHTGSDLAFLIMAILCPMFRDMREGVFAVHWR
jgi:hypothetical protein